MMTILLRFSVCVVSLTAQLQHGSDACVCLHCCGYIMVEYSEIFQGVPQSPVNQITQCKYMSDVNI